MTEEFHLTFEAPESSSALLKHLYEQQKANRFCDLTLDVNNKTFKVHRNVLAGSSQYFDSILKQHKIVKEELTLSCIDSDIFHAFIVYMYTGKITIQIENVEELLRFANYFLVSKITEYCTEFLEKYVNIDNCLVIFDLVKKYNLESINSLNNIFSTKLNDIIDGVDILNLSADSIQDFIKHEGLNIPLIKALDLFTRWVSKDRQVREKDFPKLLNTLEWISVDHNDISKHIETCYLYANSDKCFYNILSSLIQNNILLPNYKNQYEELHYKYSQDFDDSNNEKDGSDSESKTKDENGVISVTESSDAQESEKNSSLNVLIVRARQQTSRQRFIRRLMLHRLRSNMRVGSIKTVFCKKKASVVKIRKKVEGKNG